MARQSRRHALGMAMAMLLSGCEIAEPYFTPGFPFGARYNVNSDGRPVLLNDSAWWADLRDPTLDRLVALALQDNVNLEIARERVIAAQAARGTVPAASELSPSARILATGSDGGALRVTGTTGFGLSWMIDPYGLRRAQLRTADARIDIADAERDGAQLTVVLNISTAYVQLRRDQRSLALAQAELRSRLETLGLTRTLFAAESATRLEIARSEARVAEIHSQLPDLETAITADLNEIAVLAGVAPGDLVPDLAAALARPGGQPSPGLSPDVGIPADLLRNRPDIRIAERNYYVAVTAIGIARADLYPRLSLSGSITLGLLGTGASGADYFFGPAVQFPALPLYGTRAAVEVRHSEARQAHVAWKATVLAAILEVETALARYDATSTSLQSARDAVRLYHEALDLTREVFERDEATLGDLIDAEQALATAERTLADLRLQQAQRFIVLNVSLGAGSTVLPGMGAEAVAQ